DVVINCRKLEAMCQDFFELSTGLTGVPHPPCVEQISWECVLLKLLDSSTNPQKLYTKAVVHQEMKAANMDVSET
ncbi:MAG: hypothetical protein NT178_09075, partial [Proteobacteria bacterium]|nr:hypothetical protein [Pseudomonadota bacterium]